ncbi:hypothetical protein [Demequina pelophila]|uniref:hypothetical protein n=1 Tax=Demequina pelophila TaxID=1638984 RepID=UPI0007821D94|nr:hypothetical protein [Demequina pelophila]
MLAMVDGTAVGELRLRRRDLRRALARVRWWRRLVRARRDLVTAHLARPEAGGGGGLEISWEALAAGAPTTAELEEAVWPEERGWGPSTLDDLDELDTRLAAYETRTADSLDNVTAQMVHLLAAARRQEGHNR